MHDPEKRISTNTRECTNNVVGRNRLVGGTAGEESPENREKKTRPRSYVMADYVYITIIVTTFGYYFIALCILYQ